ncbi:NB-ARC domain-containing protein, partial [candidate division KSB1 bacterium]|nr:NB-ARC domain-containing protein [candidate division KSB1 bacterium]
MGEKIYNIGEITAATFNNYIQPGAAKIPKHLTRNPFIPDIFLGREADLKTIHARLFEENHLLLLVNGEGGIGKTTLAARYYCDYQAAYQHLAWIFAERSLQDALLTLAPPLKIEFPDTLPAAQRLELLLTHLAELDEPCLLVLDNANDPTDLEKHYQALRTCPNFHILLTTRITGFAGAASHKIVPLNQADAMTLFQKHYPAHQPAENELLERILVAIGYNTLVIELLAKNLAELNRLKKQYTLADLLQDLQQKGLLALKSKKIKTVYHAEDVALREASPEAIIGAMYDLSELTAEETGLLSVFAVLPAENIAWETLESLLPEAENLDESILSLARKGWLDYHETARTFKVSPVVREITLVKNQAWLRPDCQPLLKSLIEKLDYETGTGHLLNVSYEAAAQLVRYGASVVHTLTVADNDLG